MGDGERPEAKGTGRGAEGIAHSDRLREVGAERYGRVGWAAWSVSSFT
jgi:hypothetical protein